MAKFYVQCGSYQFTTSADCPRSAAIWAVHQFLDKRVDLESVDWTDPATLDRMDVIVALLDLAGEIRVSQIGCGLCDAGILETADVLTEWNQLILAVARLEQMLATAD